MKIAAVIPARMGSSRFPGKPLSTICGLSMIEHIYRRVSMADGIEGVYVATCDEEISRAVEKFGGQAIMTSNAHQRASDRTAEAAESLDVDVIVMVQGDEPLVTPEMVNLSVKPLIDDRDILCTNLTGKIRSIEEFRDRNTIKVVMNREGFALYFSREPIPTTFIKGESADLPIYKQICIIPFRRETLLEFIQLEPTPLEISESIDMLRLLEHGIRVKMVESESETHAVDTPADLQLVQKMMEIDPLFPKYA